MKSTRKIIELILESVISNISEMTDSPSSLNQRQLIKLLQPRNVEHHWVIDKLMRKITINHEMVIPVCWFHVDHYTWTWTASLQCCYGRNFLGHAWKHSKLSSPSSLCDTIIRYWIHRPHIELLIGSFLFFSFLEKLSIFESLHESLSYKYRREYLSRENTQYIFEFKEKW